MAHFEPDQVVTILDWLQDQDKAGLTLQEVIEGLIDGTLTTEIARNPYISEQNTNVA